MDLRDANSIDDLKASARRRLPRALFDFVEGGVEAEVALRTNRAAFESVRLLPRHCVDTSAGDRGTTLFGRRHASPFGIAPTGLAGLFRPDADLHLAMAARDASIPFVLSGASNASEAVSGSRSTARAIARSPRILCGVRGMSAWKPWS